MSYRNNAHARCRYISLPAGSPRLRKRAPAASLEASLISNRRGTLRGITPGNDSTKILGLEEAVRANSEINNVNAEREARPARTSQDEE